jgi:hypothetical protein
MAKAEWTSALTCTLLLVAGCGGNGGQARPPFNATHVTLYDSGLVQVERQAEVSGASALEIDVELAHLDDLLASLVVATDGGVKVSGVKFPGVQNLGQAVAASGLGNAIVDDAGGLEMPADLLGYARALVGTRVVLRDAHGKTVEGTVLDAVVPEVNETAAPEEGVQVEPPEPLILLVTNDGTLAWFPLEDVEELELASKLEASSVKNFATALGKANGFTETTLVLETTPDSKGKLAASYVRQVPMWRMLYKVRVSDEKVMLEAWAVVHNDTPESWQDVSMTLVSGLPKSYVFSVASPRYIHREVVEAPGELGEMMPQLGASTPDTLLYTWDIYRAEGGLGMFGYGGGGGGTGFGYGSGAGHISGKGYGAAGEMGSSLIQVGESAAEEGMYAEVAEEISTYTSMNKVSLPSGATSLVPLIQRQIPGEAFTLISAGLDPSTCVLMENGTGLVLQPGMASFYDDGRFRGQDEIDRLEPGDVRVLCYGGDPDVLFTRAVEIDNNYTALEWKSGALWVHTLRNTKMDYMIENLAGQPRDLAIEITHIENGRVVSPKKVVVADTDTRKLHYMSVPARSETTQHVEVEEGVMTQVTLRVSRFDTLIEAGTLPADQLKVLKSAREPVVAKEKLDEQIRDKRDLIAENEEAIRWQEDLLNKVPEMQGKSNAVDKILDEIMKARKKIASLEKEIEGIEQEQEKLLEKARAVLKALEKPEKPED